MDLFNGEIMHVPPGPPRAMPNQGLLQGLLKRPVRSPIELGSSLAAIELQIPRLVHVFIANLQPRCAWGSSSQPIEKPVHRLGIFFGGSEIPRSRKCGTFREQLLAKLQIA